MNGPPLAQKLQKMMREKTNLFHLKTKNDNFMTSKLRRIGISMSRKKKVQINRERDFIAHAELWHISGFLKKNSDNTENGKLIFLFSSTLFAVFTLEAFLNHIGKDIFEYWEEVERGLNIENKLFFICNKLNYEIPKGGKIQETIKSIIKMRNYVVHGKSGKVKDMIQVKLDKVKQDNLESITVDWEFFSHDEKKMREAIKTIESLIINLWNKAGMTGDPFAAGWQFQTSKIIEP
jgi:hypothetical protein